MKSIPIRPRTAEQTWLRYFAAKLYRKQRARLPDYFLKPDDLISEGPLTGGVHDEEVVEALRYLLQRIPGTYIDIGANIGMMAIATADAASRVECVEPNPLIGNILKTNLHLHCNNFRVHDFAIGPKNGAFQLYVPKRNMGGAFIREANSYDEDLLAAKDGYKSFQEDNYSVHSVDVIEVDHALGLIATPSLQSAVIKIDVEGFEPMIMDGIQRVYRQLFETKSIAVVFECHQREQLLKIEQATSQFEFGVYAVEVRSHSQSDWKLMDSLLRYTRGAERSVNFVPHTDPSIRGTNYILCPRLLMAP